MPSLSGPMPSSRTSVAPWAGAATTNDSTRVPRRRFMAQPSPHRRSGRGRCPRRPSKPLRRGSPTLGRFDSFVAPSSVAGMDVLAALAELARRAVVPAELGGVLQDAVEVLASVLGVEHATVM